MLVGHVRHARFPRDLLETSSRGCHEDATSCTGHRVDGCCALRALNTVEGMLTICRRYKKYRLRCARCWHIPRKQWAWSPAVWRQQISLRCQKCGLHLSQTQQLQQHQHHIVHSKHHACSNRKAESTC